VVATIEARMTSKRLPGKVMLPIKDKITVTEYLLKNIRNSKYLSKIIIATTTNPTDDILIRLADEYHICHFRGSEHNVLKRVTDAHDIASSELAVLLTADNPFVTANLIDQAIDCYINNNVEFVTNSGRNRLYPDGVDVIALNPHLLKWSLSNASDPTHFEHVCAMIYSNDQIRKYFFNSSDPQEWAPDISITVDTPEQYERAKILAQNLPLNYSVRDLISTWRKLEEQNAWI